LMAGKTKSNNIKKFAGTDSKVMREAMNRFYGKGWDKGGSGGGGKPSKPDSKPGRPGGTPGGSGSTFRSPRAVEGSQGYSAPNRGGQSQTPKSKDSRRPQVPVTSVTPQATVKAVGKKRQERTRNLVLGLATLTGVGGAARAATTGALRAGQYAAGRGAAQKAGQNLAEQAAKKGAAAAARKIAAAKKAAAAKKTATAKPAAKKTAAKKTAAKKPAAKKGITTIRSVTRTK